MPEQWQRPADRPWKGKAGLYFILLFGAVNLFADMTYEGARSVTGPFLGTLGANGFIVGTVAGLGELLGYTLRLWSGRLADRSRLYWPLTLVGYLIQMLAVPALALAGNWPLAALFILSERIGRATRNPPRNVMLAEAGAEIGRGWAFGINEALDQLGAFAGPLIVAAVLAREGNYPQAFALLAIPAFVTLLLVASARLTFPEAGRILRKAQHEPEQTYPPAFWWYLAGAALVGFGFADYSLIAYHFGQAHTVAPSWIPIFYALAMGAGGISSLIFGRLFDRAGLVLLLPITIVTAFYAPLSFLGGFLLALLGALLWGIGLSAHESVMQAVIAQMIPHNRLGSAYGLFGAVFGIAWFAGSVALGALYDVSVTAAALLAMLTQLLAILPLTVMLRKHDAV